MCRFLTAVASRAVELRLRARGPPWLWCGGFGVVCVGFGGCGVYGLWCCGVWALVVVVCVGFGG